MPAQSLKESNVASGMPMSVYPRERAAILRMMRTHKLKSQFDVFRLLAVGSPMVKKGEFRAPTVRN
jgi:hypothetical protein